jgi:membrane-associated phospholipid phosphatase
VSFSQVLAVDARLSARLRVAERPGLLRNICSLLAHSGDSWFWWPAMALLWFFGNSFWKPWALTLLLSIIGMAILVMIVKFTIRRRRPEGEWGSWYRATDPHSFPSGHAARAFLIAVISIGLGPAWLAVLLCVWAPLVALARVAMGVHYLSDIFAGGLLGIFAGVLILQVV